MSKKVTRNKNRSKKDGKIKRRGRGKPSKMADGTCNTCALLKTGRRPMRHFNRTKEPFPWVRLPQELQVKILQNLDRVDLDNCCLLNRETFELIRRNERSMKRRVIESIQIQKCYGANSGRLLLSVHSYELNNMRRFEEEINEDDENDEMKEDIDSLCFGPDVRAFSTIPRCLLKILRNAEVEELLIREGGNSSVLKKVMAIQTTYPVTEGLLVSILSCVPVDCQIQTLEIINTTMNGITSSVFLRFLHKIAPNKVVLRNITAYLAEVFTVEVLQFIVSRPCFSLISIMDSELESFTIPIGDDILRRVTAVDFEIGDQNMITIDGLKSFIQSLGSRKKKVHGVIHTGSLLNSVSFSAPPCVQLHIFRIWGDTDSVEFWFDPEYEE